MAVEHQILVIDDDEDVLSTVANLLREEGYLVHAVSNAAAGLDILERGVRPSAIILDLMMPVMNGWDFWDRHQQTPAYASIPVIILTATGLRQGSVGTARVLAKPVGMNELLSAVSSAIA